MLARPSTNRPGLNVVVLCAISILYFGGGAAAQSTTSDGSDASNDGGWRVARATYYGAPESFARRFDPKRGEGSFGILAYGSCGYTNSGGGLPYPRAEYAAAADANADYPGSCGRCYEVRCRPGLVLNNQGAPIKIINGLFEGDRFRPYLPAIDANATDTRGRRWPGNAAEAQGEQSVVCAEPAQTLLVRIADSCPCTQVLAEGAPGVAKGGETRQQTWCCGGIQHFDLAFDAFEQLAHPVFGATMLDYRPVDCDTRAPLPFEPGFISRGSILKSGVQAGWGWQTYGGRDFTLIDSANPTPTGAAAACAALTPGGGMQFRCRACDRAGYRPLEGAQALVFWIKARQAGAGASAANATASLPLKLFLRGERDNYCGAEPRLSDLKPEALGVGTAWLRYRVPLEDFKCGGREGDMTHIELQDVAPQGAPDAAFCIGDVELAR